MDHTPPEPLLPSHKTVFLAGSLGALSLVAYDSDANRFALLQHFITHGLCDDAQVLYACYSTSLTARFKKEISERKIILYELRNGVDGLAAIFSDLCHAASGNPLKIHVILDFSREGDLDRVLELIRSMQEKRGSMVTVSGIVACDIRILDDKFLHELSALIPSVIILSDQKNLLSFPEVAMGQGIAGIIPQDIVDSVVRHSLEQLILMNLKQPVSGFDIIKDISDRFHVEIPLARVYSYLYTLEDKGLVSAQIRGRAKMYVPTDPGRVFIGKRLEDLRTAHALILGY
ncbi:MAG: helix-turn-helix transcriptional regulator [Methanoregula sp.]